MQTRCTSSDRDLNACKFSRNQHSTVGGVAYTRYLLVLLYRGMEKQNAEY